jgi:hypothetical protein
MKARFQNPGDSCHKIERSCSDTARQRWRCANGKHIKLDASARNMLGCKALSHVVRGDVWVTGDSGSRL